MCVLCECPPNSPVSAVDVDVDVANVAIPLPVMGVPPGLPLPAPEQDDVIIISLMAADCLQIMS